MARFRVYQCLNYDEEDWSPLMDNLSTDYTGQLSAEDKQNGYYQTGRTVWKQLPNLYIPRHSKTTGYIAHWDKFKQLGIPRTSKLTPHPTRAGTAYCDLEAGAGARAGWGGGIQEFGNSVF